MATSLVTVLKKSIQIRSKVVLIRHSHSGSRPWGKVAGGGGSSRPLDKGGLVSQKIFSALPASVWSKNKRGSPPGPLLWMRHWFQPRLKETKRLKGVWGHGPQDPVVRRPISTNPGLNFNPGLLFFSSKAFSRTIFSILFRVANHQIVHRKN